MSGLWFGGDPDLHNTGLALVGDPENAGTIRDKVLAVGVVRVDPKLKGVRACVEMCRQASRGVDVLIAGVPYAYRAIDGFVIEGQQIYEGSKRQGRPEDLLYLACISGALLARSGAFCLEAERPIPATWKGQKDKVSGQVAICRKLGWSYQEMRDYVVPVGDEPAALAHAGGILKSSDWKHVLDAIGIAIWARHRTTLEALEAAAARYDP